VEILLVGQNALFPQGSCSADELLANCYLGGRIVAIDAIVGLLEHHMRVLQEVLADDEKLETAVDGTRIQ